MTSYSFSLISFRIYTAIVAKKAGTMISEAFHNSLKNINLKDVPGASTKADLVTETDKAVEHFIFSELKSQFPNHKFIGEESNDSQTNILLSNDFTWVIDPIDGTTNFVHGLPMVCTSIALLHNKIPVVGVVFNPIINLLFSAIIGQGAYMNEHMITTKHKPLLDLSEALVATEYGVDRDEQTVSSKLGIFLFVILRNP
jgi:fructose-1,6-bisphosphatase/inositol monophosphatase family enzyme